MRVRRVLHLHPRIRSPPHLISLQVSTSCQMLSNQSWSRSWDTRPHLHYKNHLAQRKLKVHKNFLIESTYRKKEKNKKKIKSTPWLKLYGFFARLNLVGSLFVNLAKHLPSPILPLHLISPVSTVWSILRTWKNMVWCLSIFSFLPRQLRVGISRSSFIEVVKNKQKKKLCEMVGVWLWLGFSLFFFFFLGGGLTSFV